MCYNAAAGQMQLRSCNRSCGLVRSSVLCIGVISAGYLQSHVREGVCQLGLAGPSSPQKGHVIRGLARVSLPVTRASSSGRIVASTCVELHNLSHHVAAFPAAPPV